MMPADPAIAPSLPINQSSPGAVRVLLVEDSADDTELVRQTLSQSGRQFLLHPVDSAAAMTSALAAGDWDIVLSDYNLPGFDAPQALALLLRWTPETPFIVVSGFIGEAAAVALMKAGADDYVMKDNLGRLAPAIERSLKDAWTREQGRLAHVALQASEARFKAIAANLPGTVLQLVLHAEGRWSISYASEGSQALLGIDAQALQRQPELFFDLILTEDADSFAQSMQRSASEQRAWNWEGRMRAGSGGDVKWVNLRSSPRRLGNGDVIWDGILSNITQNKLAELEIRRSREDLSRLSAHVHRIKEVERATIAREIHDDLGGTLTAIKIELMRLGRDLAPNAAQALEHLRSAETLVDGAMDATRRIATDLRPGILDLGIVAAIEWQCADFQKRMDLPCRLSCVLDEIALDDETSITLFRILQEAMTNIAKHAGASRVDVELDAGAQRVTLRVRDDGRGIDAADLSKRGAFGILGMKERVRQLGGELHFSRGGGGAEIGVSLPRAPASALAQGTP